MRPLPALLVGLMAAALAPVGTRVAPASAQTAPSAPDRPALIMTFNIHHGVGPDGRLDLHRIAEVVRNAGPAIVGFRRLTVIGLSEATSWTRHRGSRANSKCTWSTARTSTSTPPSRVLHAASTAPRS